MNEKESGGAAGEGEKDLVERVLAGDRQAFEVLVLKYQERIFRLVRRMVGNREQVEDLAQEVFLRAYRSLGSFKGDSTLFTWLYKIALNTCRNHYRSIGRRPEGSAVHSDEVLEYVASSVPSPEQETMRREMWERVRASLQELPVEQREAVVLCDLEGLSYEEIALVAGIPVGTVRSRVFRGRRSLQQRLSPYLPGAVPAGREREN